MRLSSLLCLATALTAISPAKASDELRQNLQRIFAGKALDGKSFGPARWIRNGASFTTVEPSAQDSGVREIIEYDTATGKRSPLVTAAQLTVRDQKKVLSIEDYWWDRTMRRLLIFTETKKYWRTNSLGDYWVLDLQSGELKKIGDAGTPASSLMYATFSPDGTQVAYVRAGNIYVEDLNTGTVHALTSGGSDTVGNGAGDWVYEEELNLRQAFRWSPDGRHIAYWQFDESGVERFTMINNTDSLYPKLITFPYPKAGTTNPAVRIGVVAAAGGEPKWISVPGDPRENYLFRTDWIDERRIGIGQLNRRQNQVSIYVAELENGSAKPIFEDHDEAWVDLPESAGAARPGESFLWINGRKSFLWLSERDGWRRAWTVPFDKAAHAEPVTPANLDVIEVAAVDPESRWLYYIASTENATERYLYRSPLAAAGPAQRLSPASHAGTHAYDVSPDCRWAFHTYSTFDSPPVVDLVSLPDLRSLRVLESNEKLRANASSLLDPPVEFLRVNTRDGATLDGWLLRPRNFDPAKKYPVVIYVYGEPFGLTATNAWPGKRGLFHRALAASGYVVASFDNRGTPAPKGRAWRKSIYGMVGVLSTRDQTDAILALVKERAWIDRDRIAVWGWSGGGTNTLNLMFRSPDVYRVGISVAPVSDQTLYDTIYQERYMRTPRDNAEGYASASAIHFADGLRGDLLIIHGSGDDNVHYQGTERLINRLVELGKTFDFMEYPNRSHSISEGNGTSLHLYSLIARYIEEHLPSGAR
jgi:dipeptidyl-peptidase-4